MPVILAADFPPAVGGIQRYLGRVAAELAASGQRVAVVAPGAADPFDRSCAYRVIRFGEGFNGRMGQLAAMHRALAEAERYVRDRVVLASSWYPAGLVAVPRRFGRRGTLAVMAFGTEITQRNSALRKRLMRGVFARADAILSISRYTSRCLRDAGVNREPVLVGCGVDRGSFRPAPGPFPTILSVGRLCRRKGFDRVIAALPVLRSRFPGLRYEIVGDGPDRGYLAELATVHGVRPDVVFHGRIGDEDLKAAYERAWCFALPVRREGDDVEGFGLVYLEAATASLAAVGGRGSGAEDAIVHGSSGLLVDGERQRDVVHALDVLLRDRDFASRLGANAYERALRDFSWSRVAAAVAAGIGL